MADGHSDSSVSTKQKATASSNGPPEEEKTDEAPWLIGEGGGELPMSYRLLVERLGSRRRPLGRNDRLVCFVHVMMLEEGFVVEECADEEPDRSTGFSLSRVLRLAPKIPSDWQKTNNVYELNYVLKPFPLHVVKLVCVASLDDIIINCRISGLSNTCFTMLVDPSMYIVSSVTSVKYRYQHLGSFAMYFKNQISNPAKVTIMAKNKAKCPCILHLPPELQLHLEGYAKNVDLKKVFQ